MEDAIPEFPSLGLCQECRANPAVYVVLPTRQALSRVPGCEGARFRTTMDGAYDPQVVFHEVRARDRGYRGLGVRLPSDGEGPDGLRFDWDPATTLLHTSAHWLKRLRYVLRQFPPHGGSIGAAEQALEPGG